MIHVPPPQPIVKSNNKVFKDLIRNEINIFLKHSTRKYTIIDHPAIKLTQRIIVKNKYTTSTSSTKVLPRFGAATWITFIHSAQLMVISIVELSTHMSFLIMSIHIRLGLPLDLLAPWTNPESN